MASTPPTQLSIPIVDLLAFAAGDAKQRQKSAQDLTNACQDLGFVYITGHGISPCRLQEAFGWCKKLYDLSLEDKMKAPHPPGPIPHRGYSHPGLEKVFHKKDLELADAQNSHKELRKISDFKESYEIGSENNPAQPNVWLPEDVLPGFRDFMTDFYWSLNETATTVLLALGEGLGLGEIEMAELLGLHSGHNNQLRLLHYPPIPAEQLETQVIARMPAHTDWGTFTMLFQDDCGGLELEDPNNLGTFLPATPVQDALVLNIGDMFQRLSNDTFKSATHRVTLPPLRERYAGEERITRARYSIPYFVAPDDTAIIKCLPSRVNEMNPVKYEPIAFQDYGAWMAKYQYQKETTV